MQDTLLDRTVAAGRGASARRIPLSFGLIVPTLNAADRFRNWLEALAHQTLQPQRCLVVDSGSRDSTVALALQFGLDVQPLGRCTFSHGGTRQAALQMLPDVDVVVFMTQDAILADRQSLAALMKAFDDQLVAAAYGRQLPRAEADPIEAHARLFNYPASSHRRGLADVIQLGFKLCFISNAYAAWRTEAVAAAGGFPSAAVQSEDAFLAARLILSGYTIAYCADATVFHSHGLSTSAEARRYFDTGVFHARHPWIRQAFGSAEREGLRFVKSELAFLKDRRPSLIPVALLRDAVRLAAFRLGRMERNLPVAIKRRISANQGFWERESS